MRSLIKYFTHALKSIAAIINYLAPFSTIDVNQVDGLTIAAGSVQGKNYILSQAITFTGIEITNSVPSPKVEFTSRVPACFSTTI